MTLKLAFRALSRVLFAVSSQLVPVLAQAPETVFRSTTNLQSISVQVLDRQGNYVPGLTASDFTLLEDGQPRNIAFFGAEHQPVSLAILLDSSRSMDFGGKLQRARELLVPLARGNHADDEIFFMPFTDRIAGFQQITLGQRLNAVATNAVPGHNGTALYDALASALCHMRTAQNVRQAVVVITDGADQHSRLNLEQLIDLTQVSNPQIFMIGFFAKPEFEEYRERHKTVTLVGEREIDNPLIVFERLSKESGAESFFPASEQDLEKALERISAILQAQYTLAYYPRNAERFRRIEVKVRRSGVRVLARRGVGSAARGGPVHFALSSCEVSPQAHPYPWESRASPSLSGTLTYREDFSDPRTGWPNRREEAPASPASRRDLPAGNEEYRPGLRYLNGAYEMSRHPPKNLISIGPIADGDVVAYGPSWDDFRASVSVEGDLGQIVGLGQSGHYATAAGLVFHLKEEGYYALVLTGAMSSGMARTAKDVQFKLIKRRFGAQAGAQSDIVPWTPIVPVDALSGRPFSKAKDPHTISVEYKQGRIRALVDEKQVAAVQDNTFPGGLIGFGLFGDGRAVFRDLLVQGQP